MTLRYRSVPHPLWAPGRLDAAARLHGCAGLPARPLRVLDIGCGSGGNALAIAARHPDWHVTGFDVDAAAISLGNMLAGEAGLTNCTLHVADLNTINAADLPDEPFDLIMLHGMVSWLPEEAANAAWDLAAQVLGSAGLLVVDYHALPGFRLRQIARDVVRGCSDPETARARLMNVAQSNVTGGAYGATLRAEAERISTRDGSIMEYDEMLAGVRGFALDEVVELSSVHGLSYIGSATPTDWWAFHDPPTIAVGSSLPMDRIDRAVYCDQVRGVAFHVSVFGRGDAFDDICSDRVHELRAERRVGAAGSAYVGTLKHHALHRRVLESIEAALHAPTVRDLATQLGVPIDDASTAILQLAADDAISLTTLPLDPSPPGRHPRTWALARTALRHDAWAHTQRNSYVDVPDPLVRMLLTAMDGTRTVDEIADMLRAWGTAHGRDIDAARAAESLPLHIEHFNRLGLLESA